MVEVALTIKGRLAEVGLQDTAEPLASQRARWVQRPEEAQQVVRPSHCPYSDHWSHRANSQKEMGMRQYGPNFLITSIACSYPSPLMKPPRRASVAVHQTGDDGAVRVVDDALNPPLRGTRGDPWSRAIVARGGRPRGVSLPWGRRVPKFSHHGVSPYSRDVNIAIVRVRGRAPVSSFVDQMRRHYIPDTGHDVASFIDYLRTNATIERPHHTGSVDSMCLGERRARFDHIIDLEDIASFARVARMVPAYGALLEHGWEHCTNGDPRLYISGSAPTVNPHRNTDVELKHTLCTPEALRQVCWTYRRDYELYTRLGHPFKCRCEATVRHEGVSAMA